MIRKSIILSSFGFLLMLGSYVYACGGSSCSGNSCGGGCSCNRGSHTNHQCTDTNVVQTNEKAIDMGNKICPVEGAKIGSMGDPVKVTHGGKVYNLCCASCVDKFKADPEKYIKIDGNT